MKTRLLLLSLIVLALAGCAGNGIVLRAEYADPDNPNAKISFETAK